MNIDLKQMLLIAVVVIVLMKMKKNNRVENMVDVGVDVGNLKNNAMSTVNIPKLNLTPQNVGNNLNNLTGGVPLNKAVSLPLGSGNKVDLNPVKNMDNSFKNNMPDLSNMGDEIKMRTLMAIANSPQQQVVEKKSNLVLYIVAGCLLVAIGVVLYFIIKNKKSESPVSVVPAVNPVVPAVNPAVPAVNTVVPGVQQVVPLSNVYPGQVPVIQSGISSPPVIVQPTTLSSPVSSASPLQTITPASN